MPHFTRQIEPAGPLVNVQIGLSLPHVRALNVADQAVPPALFVKGLVDTGASMTGIDPKHRVRFDVAAERERSVGDSVHWESTCNQAAVRCVREYLLGYFAAALGYSCLTRAGVRPSQSGHPGADRSRHSCKVLVELQRYHKHLHVGFLK